MNLNQLKKPVTPGAMWGMRGKWGRWHLPSPQQAGTRALEGRVAAGEPASVACILHKDEG